MNFFADTAEIDDINMDGLGLVADIRTIFDNYGFETRILAASVRPVNHITDGTPIRTDAVAASLAALRKMADRPLTGNGRAALKHDGEKTGQRIV